MRYILQILAIFIFLTGFSNFVSAKAVNSVGNKNYKQVRISQNNWQLTKIGTQEINDSKAFIKFDEHEKRVGGNGGCNSFGGSFSREKNKIKIGQLISTKMACMDNNRMQTENEFFKNLASVTSYKIRNGKLRLFAGREMVLEFRLKK